MMQLRCVLAPTEALGEAVPPLKIVQQSPCIVVGHIRSMFRLGLTHVVQVCPVAVEAATSVSKPH